MEAEHLVSPLPFKALKAEWSETHNPVFPLEKNCDSKAFYCLLVEGVEQINKRVKLEMAREKRN